MNICIDIGNSSVKYAIFDNEVMTYHSRMESHDFSLLQNITKEYDVDRCIISSTCNYGEEEKSLLQNLCKEVVFFNHTTPIPIKNLYKTPETLGMDRLAAAIGAYYESKQDTAIIDAGTAINYDIVTRQGEYLGGNISPGIEMRFKALHEYTAKLPLINKNGDLPELGNDTETAIRCGVIQGVSYEIRQFICEMLLKFPNLYIFITGGDDIDFGNSNKKRIFVDRYLVLKGLNVVLNNLK